MNTKKYVHVNETSKIHEGEVFTICNKRVMFLNPLKYNSIHP